jgi:group I intron endonuclease
MIRPDELNGCSRTYVSGIYQIKNLVNEKIYIGSSNHLYRRYTDHLRLLNRGSHFNPKLQASWNKYGKDAFEFSVLEYCLPVRLVELEQLYINRLHPYFNISMEVGIPNTPKAGTPEAAARYIKVRKSIQQNGTFESKEHHDLMSGLMWERWQDDDYRKSRSSETTQLWNDQEYREKQKHSHRKIDSSGREYIRNLISMGAKMKSLAKNFGVSYETIRRINLGLH